MQPRQRRFFVPAVLALIAVMMAWLAVQAGADGPVAAAGKAREQAATTPVLSARRIAPYLVAPIADAKLTERLAQVVAESPDLTCLTVSVGGRIIFTHNPDLPVTPASNQKLVTATAALADLGPDTRFRTRVVATGLDDGTVNGDLFLVGGGDPLLSTQPYRDHFRNQPQIATSLEKLADAVVAAGVKRVQGRLVGDETRYDNDRYPDSWPRRYADQNQVGPLSALSVNDGFSAWPSEQTQEGTVEGTPAQEPAAEAATVFRTLLAQRGVEFASGTGVGPAPADAAEVAAIESPPMSQVVTELLTESDNQTAEMLVKELGLAKGTGPTTDAGVAVVTDTMERLGLARPGTVATDGSGLDEGNRSSCRLLMGVLDRGGPDSLIADSLAVAGKTGTLADRFVDSPAKERLRAKTGTLNQVTALTGFVESTQGATLTFAYVANGVYVNPGLLKLQEAMGGDLVTYPEGPSLALVGPQP